SLDPLLSDLQIINTGTQTDISAFHIDSEGNIWLGWGIWDEDLVRFTTPGNILLSKLTRDGTRTDLAKLEAGLGTKTVTSFYTDNDLLVLSTWGDGIYTRVGNNDFQQQITNSVGFPKISDIDVDQDQAMWFASGYIDAEPVKKGSLGVSFFENESWQTLTMNNSPLHNDSIHSLAVDSANRLWFAAWDVLDNNPMGWMNALTVYDKPNDSWKRITITGTRDWNPDTQNWGPILPGKAFLLSNTIGGVDLDKHGNVFVAGYDRGFSVIAPDYTLLGSFMINNSNSQRVLNMYHNGRQYFFGTYNDNGLVIWNDDSIPVTGGDKWLTPPPTDLANCQVYGVTSTNSKYYGWQHWIAASNGLYMWDETNWYKYDSSVKRFIFNTTSRLWTNDQLYYVDEERLFGSVRTVPASIYQDPFGRVWIGSLANGISMYDPDTDRFTNYFLPKDPLLSNYITALGYEPVSGKLWIGTPDGLNTLLIGKAIKPITDLETVKAFPNPFKPEVNGTVQIVNLPIDSMPRGKNQCRIYDSSGALIANLEENEFARFVWDGKNGAGKKVSSGIYFYVVSDEKGNSKRGKIALIN
ncbi:MAG TPA: gliding motility-associated C-terminal domain-containing protein, partial [Candidatus Cloacimonadota bacterium]|nr:gliding motility-associated C-terminal domain-containing protein [Candidatus Cloacimonadota bacterium]